MAGQSITNTPGIYYALAYWLSCNMIILISPKRIDKLKIIGVQMIFLFLLASIMIASDGVVRLFIPFMMLYIIMIFFSIFINCLYDIKTALYFAVRAFIIGEFTASFEWQIVYYSGNSWNVPLNRLTEVLFIIGVHTIVYFVLYQLEKKNQKVNINIAINYRELLSVTVIGLAIFLISNMSYIIGGSLFSSHFVKEIFIIRTLVDLGGVAILYAYHIQLGELNTRLEVEKLQDMLSMQYNNYEMMEKSIEAINHKYHDLKYQIAILKQEANAKDSIAYLNQMEQEIKIYEAQNKTGNKILDTILTAQSIYCQNNWIELTCVADGTAVDFMDDIDVSTLFGNMLDNAIESVSKIDKKEKRLIHLTVTKQKGFLRIRVENCYHEELVFENGLPATTKKDRRYHGYGLKSIRNTVKKYDGSVTINAKNGWFELRILIPLADKI